MIEIWLWGGLLTMAFQLGAVMNAPRLRRKRAWPLNVLFWGALWPGFWLILAIWQGDWR